MIKVLYVDDEISNLDSFIASFRRDFNIKTAKSAEEARIIIETEDIHVLVTDQRMPGTSGTILLSEASKKYPNITRILLTGYTDYEALIEAINIGHIYKYIEKPWDEDVLRQYITDAHNICILKRLKESSIKTLKEANEELERVLSNKPTND